VGKKERARKSTFHRSEYTWEARGEDVGGNSPGEADTRCQLLMVIVGIIEI